MRSSDRKRLPPASWIERVATAIAGTWGVDLDTLADTDAYVAAWFATGIEPERIALDEVDRALAAWLKSLSKVTRSTYQQYLRVLAAGLEFEGPRSVRAMIDAAIANPSAMEKRLRRFTRETDWKAGTVRGRLLALHRASRELVSVGLAVRTVAGERPHYDDVTVRGATHADVHAVDALLRSVAGPVAARTRAVLHLAWSAALAPRELLKLQHENVHLERRVLVLVDRRVSLDRDALDALRGWLAHRGRTDGPLLIALEGKLHRLTNRAITARVLQRSVAEAARAAGVEVTLSGLRNGALLVALKKQDRQTAQRLANTEDRGMVNRLIRHA